MERPKNVWNEIDIMTVFEWIQLDQCGCAISILSIVDYRIFRFIFAIIIFFLRSPKYHEFKLNKLEAQTKHATNLFVSFIFLYRTLFLLYVVNDLQQRHLHKLSHN